MENWFNLFVDHYNREVISTLQSRHAAEGSDEPQYSVALITHYKHTSKTILVAGAGGDCNIGDVLGI